MEIWLRTNTRALWFGMVPPAMVGAIGALLVFGLPGLDPPRWLQIVGGVLVALAALVILSLALQMRKPRLAYRDGELWLWLRSGEPFRVPIEFVECFLLGQAPSLLPGKRHESTETAALTIRIAERAADWHQQDVKPQLGKWCGGYISVRGTWCEPLSLALVNRLNQRLYDVTNEARQVGSH